LQHAAASFGNSKAVEAQKLLNILKVKAENSHYGREELHLPAEKEK